VAKKGSKGRRTKEKDRDGERKKKDDWVPKPSAMSGKNEECNHYGKNVDEMVTYLNGACGSNQCGKRAGKKKGNTRNREG